MNLTFSADNIDAINAQVAEHLRAVGFIVETPRKWERPGVLAKRLGVNITTITRAMRHPGCPRVPLVKSSGGKRFALIVATAELDEFITRNIQNPQPQKARPGNQNRRRKRS